MSCGLLLLFLLLLFLLFFSPDLLCIPASLRRKLHSSYPPPIDSNGKHACLQRRRSERRRQEPPPDPVSRQTVPPLWRRAETAHPPAPLPFRNTSSSSSSSSTCRRLYTKEASCLCPAATPDRKGQDTSALCSSWSGTESRLGRPGPLNRVSISCFPPALSSCGTGSKAEQPAQKGTQPRGRGER